MELTKAPSSPRQAAPLNVKIQWPGPASNLIMVADGLVDPLMARQLVNDLAPFRQTHFMNGLTMGGSQPNMKLTKDAVLYQEGFERAGLPWTPFMADCEQAFYDAISRSIAEYSAKYESFDPLQLDDTGYLVQTYEKGVGYYHNHIDGAQWTSTSNRVLTVVIYLNDVVEGGETYFPIQGIKVPPRAGRVAVFPAAWTHPHEALTPLSSDKWIISSFITTVHGH